MNAISTPIQALLDLFATELEDVRFADVDAKTLERIAADVESAAVTVAAAQAALDGARGALQDRQDVLLQYAQRALAYARVYAESDPSLSASLEAIALPRIAKRSRVDGAEALVLSPEPQAPVKRRGRARKEDVAKDELTASFIDDRRIDDRGLDEVTSAAE